MNLTQEFPRSPREKIADLVHLPRMIDKARAARHNTLGEYIYPCPLDQIMLDFLGVDPETFQKKVCNEVDEALAVWIENRCQNRSPGEKEAANHKILESRPDNPEKQKKFHDILKGIDSSRSDITTWVDLIDLEEGRL